MIDAPVVAEGPRPPAAEAPPPPPVESIRAPEVSRQRQETETQRIASTIIHRRGRQIDNMNAEERNAALSQDQADGYISVLYKFNTMAGDQDFRADGGINVWDEARPLTVMDNGVRKTLGKIERFDGVNFICKEKVESGRGGGLVRVSKGELLRAQLLATADVIVASSNFTEAERDVMKMYVGLAEGKGIGEGEDINTKIQQAAESAGILTAEDLRDFTDNYLRKREANMDLEGQKLPAGEAERNERLKQEVDAVLEGKNIVEYGTMAAVVAKVGGGAYGGKDMEEGGRLGKYFKDMEEGAIDLGKSQVVKGAVREGDLGRALSMKEGKEGEGKVGEVIGQQIEEVQEEIEVLKTAIEGGDSEKNISELRKKMREETDEAKKREIQRDIDALKDEPDQLKKLQQLSGLLKIGQTGQGEKGGAIIRQVGMRGLLDQKGYRSVGADVMKAHRDELHEAQQAFIDLLSITGILPKGELHQLQLEIQEKGMVALEERVINMMLNKGGMDKNVETFLFGEEGLKGVNMEQLLKDSGIWSDERAKMLMLAGKKGSMGLLMLMMYLTNAFMKDMGWTPK